MNKTTALSLAGLILLSFIVFKGYNPNSTEAMSEPDVLPVAEVDDTQFEDDVAYQPEIKSPSENTAQLQESPALDAPPVSKAELDYSAPLAESRTVSNHDVAVDYSDRPKFYTETVDLLRGNAEQQNWGEMLHDLSDTQEHPPGLLFETLQMAMEYDAPMWVFEDLLFRGAQFEYLHLFYLVRSNKLDMLKGLQALGLDLHMTDAIGNNALHVLVRDTRNLYLLSHLVTNGMDVQVKLNGKDLLQLALERMLSGVESGPPSSEAKMFNRVHGRFFALGLAYYGARIMPHHLALVEQIRDISEQDYEWLIKKDDRFSLD